MRTVTTRWALWVAAASLALSGAACAAPTEDDGTSAQSDALATVGTLIPETAPTAAIVLANADLFAGINELHYTLLRGL